MVYAFDAIRRRPGRSILTALGIGLATALVVILLAISAGIQSSAEQLATQSGVDLIGTSHGTSVENGTYPYVAQAHDTVSQIPAADPNVETVSPWLVGDLVFGNSTLYEAANATRNGSGIPAGWFPTSAAAIGWIPSDNTGIETPLVLSGPGFSQTGDPHYDNGSYQGPATHEIVLDQGLAGVLHVSLGGLVWLGLSTPANSSEIPGWYSSATAFRVVGISGPFWLIPSALISFLYLSEYQSLIGGASRSTDYASLILIHLFDPTNPAQDQARLATAFPSLTFITLSQILGAIQSVVNLYKTFGVIIGLIGIVVATLFAMTVLLMSVDDRSRELALLRAVGFPRSAVGGLVVQEALLLALGGLAIGLPIAYVATQALNHFLQALVSGLPAGFSFVSFNAAVIAAGLGEVLLIGLIASILPASRAMQLPVAEELRAP
ncbi:MAG: ABC transporter permease [Thermoplasmata archaeon]